MRIARRCGVNAHLKVPCLVAGMIGGADSIDDMNLLRHGAMSALFGGIRAPSTLGSFLRAFTWGNVLKLGKVNRLLLGELARRAPLLPGKDTLAFIDIDSMQKRVYGHGLGHRFALGTELLQARMPTPDEVQALELNPRVPVVRLLHIDYDPDGRTLQVADDLYDADRHEFAFEWTEPDGVPVDE